MSSQSSPNPPVVLLTFANEIDTKLRYSRDLQAEARRLRLTLDAAVAAGLCEVETLEFATIDLITSTFHRDLDQPIAIFHFSGHSHSLDLLMESNQNQPNKQGNEFASFLGSQQGLQLVFLNSGATESQIEALLMAGVPIVITTSAQLNHASAITFAERFYEGLTRGASISESYAHADTTSRAAITTGMIEISNEEADDESYLKLWPWSMNVREESVSLLQTNPLTRVAAPPLRGETDVPLEAIQPTSQGPKGALAENDAAPSHDNRPPVRKPYIAESVTTHADSPATFDELGRRPFAEVLAARIEEVWLARPPKNDTSGAFMVHINGPWGAGKTSVLNFLAADLQQKGRNPEWVVVNFNAWRHQRIRPPWWTMITEIYAQSVRQLRFPRSLRLRWLWIIWRIRADWIPIFVASILIVLTLLLVTGIFNPFANLAIADPSSPTNTDANVISTDAFAKGAELGLKVIAALFTVGAAVFAFSRSLVFGSARRAGIY